MSAIRVFLADDHALLRSGLRRLIESQADLRVVGEAGTFPDTLTGIASVEADILILDLTMQGSVGVGGVEKIRRHAPGVKIIVLTMHDDPAYARSSMAMGASGYLVKSVADEELISTIRAVVRGGMYVHVGADTGLRPVQLADRSTDRRAPVNSLSMREREVLGLVALGHTNQVVADRLGISVKTIESYRSRLMQKLGLTNRADLMRFAIDCGLLGQNEAS